MFEVREIGTVEGRSRRKRKKRRNDVKSPYYGRFHSAERMLNVRNSPFLLKYPVPFIFGAQQSTRDHFSHDVTLALR